MIRKLRWQFVGVCMALVLTVLFESFAEPLLLMFGASENTVGYALDYMRIYALGTIFVQLTLGMNAYITAQGFATVSMKTVLIGATRCSSSCSVSACAARRWRR